MLDDIKKKWEEELGRELTEAEKEVIELTEGEIDLRLGYCPSIYGGEVKIGK